MLKRNYKLTMNYKIMLNFVTKNKVKETYFLVG